MPQLMAGIALSAQADFFEIFIDHRLDSLDRHPAVVPADKEGVFVLNAVNGTNAHIIVYRVYAGGIKV